MTTTAPPLPRESFVSGAAYARRIMQTVSRQAHVTLSGDIAGDYVVEDRGADGRLVLTPDLSVKAILARHGERPMNAENFERHFGDLPTDDEG